jgi:hypothetical protein
MSVNPRGRRYGTPREEHCTIARQNSYKVTVMVLLQQHHNTVVGED